MASCKLCYKEITFSSEPEYISPTGKKYPLDIDSAGVIVGRHECLVWEVEHRKYYICRKGCGGEIYFDRKQKTSSGGWIPISKETGFPHKCGDKYQR